MILKGKIIQMSIPHKYLLSTNGMPISVPDEKTEKIDMVPALQSL